ncbi:hypothetical protein [Deinococcus navajonensis]|uniref:Uncharacterized protein n=1 Tax=Deinococcus navajonensis TaxID=309884 RepID=A0ABV8XKF2_9DEIO
MLILLLVCVNIGGLLSLVWKLSHGEWLAALGSLAMLLLLSAVGVWLLREGP